MSVEPKPNAFVASSAFRDKGASVEEARAAMLKAGETPKGLLDAHAREVAKTNPNDVPAVPVAAPSRLAKKTPTQAWFTMVDAEGNPKSQRELVTAANTVELQQIINRNHANAVSKGFRIKVDFVDPENPVTGNEPEETQEETLEEAAVVAPVTTEEEPETSSEVIDNNKFHGELRQENGEWIAEISYKNGGGTERFAGKTRKEVFMKILEGKAHATLRIREAIRREKYGVELDQVYTLPDYMTQEAFDTLPEPAKQAIIDTIAVQEAHTLHQLHPEFYITEENSIKMQKFLTHKNLPYTATNLTYAYQELLEADELEIRPAPAKVEPSVSRPATSAGDSAAASAAPVAPATVQPAPAAVGPVRKRGTTGLKPSQSSVAPTELETPTKTEEANKPRELSEAELRALPLSELKKLARSTFKPQGNRRF